MWIVCVEVGQESEQDTDIQSVHNINIKKKKPISR